jgi:predicted nucleic acid-binding protein
MKIFDTTFLVDFLRRAPEAKRLAQDLEDRGERPATTEVNAFELLVGAYEEGRINRERFAQVQQLLQGLDVLALDRAGAIRAAELLSGLSARGRTPGVLDILVAGIALASGYDTIVTNDEGFRRIPSIKVQAH